MNYCDVFNDTLMFTSTNLTYRMSCNRNNVFFNLLKWWSISRTSVPSWQHQSVPVSNRKRKEKSNIYIVSETINRTLTRQSLSKHFWTPSQWVLFNKTFTHYQYWESCLLYVSYLWHTKTITVGTFTGNGERGWENEDGVLEGLNRVKNWTSLSNASVAIVIFNRP